MVLIDHRENDASINPTSCQNAFTDMELTEPFRIPDVIDISCNAVGDDILCERTTRRRGSNRMCNCRYVSSDAEPSRIERSGRAQVQSAHATTMGVTVLWAQCMWRMTRQ